MLHTWVCLCTCVLSRVWLFATPGTAACQAPLFMGFPRQAYWSGLPFPPPGDLSDPGMEPTSPALPLIMILKCNVRLWDTRKYFSLCPSSWHRAPKTLISQMIEMLGASFVLILDPWLQLLTVNSQTPWNFLGDKIFVLMRQSLVSSWMGAGYQKDHGEREGLEIELMTDHAHMMMPPLKKSPKYGVQRASALVNTFICWEEGIPQLHGGRSSWAWDSSWLHLVLSLHLTAHRYHLSYALLYNKLVIIYNNNKLNVFPSLLWAALTNHQIQGVGDHGNLWVVAKMDRVVSNLGTHYLQLSVEMGGGSHNGLSP